MRLKIVRGESIKMVLSKRRLLRWIQWNRRRLFVIGGVLLAVCLGIVVTVYSCAQRDSHTPYGDVAGEIGGVPVHTQWIEEGSGGRPGTLRKIEYIVIHETANSAEGANAAAHARYLSEGGDGSTSWHYTVDDRQIYHHVPDNEVAWHAGDRDGNQHGVGVELCVNEDGDFDKTFDNAAKLTAYLLKHYDLEVMDVKQHHDCSGKDCPQHIRETNRWVEFLDAVKGYRAELG